MSHEYSEYGEDRSWEQPGKSKKILRQVKKWQQRRSGKTRYPPDPKMTVEPGDPLYGTPVSKSRIKHAIKRKIKKGK